MHGVSVQKMKPHLRSATQEDFEFAFAAKKDALGPHITVWLGVMNKEEARVAIERALARESATPTLGTNDRDTYMKEMASELRAALIDPVPVRIVGESFEYGAKKELEQTPLFAVARRGSNWLVYSSERDLFSLAFGVDPSALSILGFASGDALAEWLG